LKEFEELSASEAGRLQSQAMTKSNPEESQQSFNHELAIIAQQNAEKASEALERALNEAENFY
jgi:hypothetical protein